MVKLKKGDEIIITIGKDKGKIGKVEQVIKKESTVLVPGLNLYKRHMKRRDEKQTGGIVDFPRPIPLGNVTLICPKCKKPTRVGFIVAKSEKHRICKKCGTNI
ncbi:MAG: 50S ribosomal protein L24 [Patescibacteria group bacterium]